MVLVATESPVEDPEVEEGQMATRYAYTNSHFMPVHEVVGFLDWHRRKLLKNALDGEIADDDE
jgi:hypothetical protein